MRNPLATGRNSKQSETNYIQITQISVACQVWRNVEKSHAEENAFALCATVISLQSVSEFHSEAGQIAFFYPRFTCKSNNFYVTSIRVSNYCKYSIFLIELKGIVFNFMISFFISKFLKHPTVDVNVKNFLIRHTDQM